MRLLLLGIIFLSSCKTLHRDIADSAYEIQAVSDNHLTLGAVAIEDEHGNQAYRLLLCKNSITFPEWMLNDESRCRPALLMPESKEEALLLPGQIEQNFAQKYKGDLKYLATLSTVTAAFCGAALFGSRLILKHFKLAGHFKKVGELKQVSPMKSKIDYINASKRYKKAKSKGLGHRELLEREFDLREKTIIYDAALRLEKLRTEQELLEAMLDGLGKGESDAILTTFKEKNGKFISELKRSGGKAYKRELKYHQELAGLADSYKDADQAKIADRLEELKKDEVPTSIADYRVKLQNRTYGIAGWNIEKIRNSISVSAGHIGSFSLLYSINHSIWGHDDRMVSKYWSKIFLRQDDFSQPTIVESIALILQILADTFDLVVNAEALKLREDDSSTPALQDDSSQG